MKCHQLRENGRVSARNQMKLVAVKIQLTKCDENVSTESPSRQLRVAANKSKPLKKTMKHLPIRSNGKKAIGQKSDVESSDSDNTVSQQINSPSDQEGCESINSDVSWSLTVNSRERVETENSDSTDPADSDVSSASDEMKQQQNSKTGKSNTIKNSKSKLNSNKAHGVEGLEKIAKRCGVLPKSKKYKVIFGNYKSPKHWSECLYDLLHRSNMEGPPKKISDATEIKREVKNLKSNNTEQSGGGRQKKTAKKTSSTSQPIARRVARSNK